MGQKLYNAKAKRSKILEDWKTGDGAIWELSVDCVAANKELSAQVSSNETS